MNMNADELSELIESLALQNVADSSQKGLDHGSTICRVLKKSWQVDIISSNDSMPKVENPEELRKIMQDPKEPVLFIPESSFITEETLEKICIENPLNKIIIMELD